METNLQVDIRCGSCRNFRHCLVERILHRAVAKVKARLDFGLVGAGINLVGSRLRVPLRIRSMGIPQGALTNAAFWFILSLKIPSTRIRDRRSFP